MKLSHFKSIAILAVGVTAAPVVPLYIIPIIFVDQCSHYQAKFAPNHSSGKPNASSYLPNRTYSSRKPYSSAIDSDNTPSLIANNHAGDTSSDPANYSYSSREPYSSAIDSDNAPPLIANNHAGDTPSDLANYSYSPRESDHSTIHFRYSHIAWKSNHLTIYTHCPHAPNLHLYPSRPHNCGSIFSIRSQNNVSTVSS
jgi:hypothetical protein